MFQVKLYKYSSTAADYKGTDYSAYILQGAENKEDISNEIDTSEISLMGVDLETAFAPETKFIIDILQDGEIVETLHRVVNNDYCEKVVLGESDYWKHTISFYEPSVIAQKRTCDNMAATYLLKDVSLSTQTAFDINENANFDGVSGQFGVDFVFNTVELERGTYGFAKYFKFEQNDKIKIYPVGQSSYANKEKKYQLITDYTSGNAMIHIPKLGIYEGVENTSNFALSGYVSLSVKVVERETGVYYNYNIISNSQFGKFPFFSNSEQVQDNFYKEWRVEYNSKETDGATFYLRKHIRKYSDISAANPSYEIGPLNIKDGYNYDIEISLYEFDDEIPAYFEPTYSRALAEKADYVGCGSKISVKGFIAYVFNVDNLKFPNLNSYSASTSFTFYTEPTIQKVLQSANPYSAQYMLQKAILNADVYKKQSGISCEYLNATNSQGTFNYDCPFYIDNNYTQELALAEVRETFFNQKNLWEVATEVGGYIHAIPEIKFGDNDKFVITFNKLGATDEKTNFAQKSSVFNFRGIDDYISAADSYIDNIVQLGGYVTEVVSPKTISEDFLVYNDSAVIESSKPIIELLSLKCKCVNPNGVKDANDNTIITYNQVGDLTEHIYEKNVYDILSIGATDVPNKGICLYYNLGEKSILGGQYQLPQSVTNAYTDYTIKKAIYCAYYGYPNFGGNVPTSGPWTKIKAIDFVFEIKYRTKDSARIKSVRPDIRKYLLSSKFDKYPMHNQFNNQTDVLVDSEAFGKNLYGKLIRTGNLNYTENEWVDNYANLKHKGELYRLGVDDNLYYVSKVTNTFFAEHISSAVEYSKDYNQLSPVIGIPSEPRFYEISEQSQIRREVSIDNFVLCTTDSTNIASALREDIVNFSHIRALMFGKADFARWAMTVFKGDANADSETRTGERNHFVEVVHPINPYSVGNTLTYEWDMKDNFSAGDQLGETESYKSTDSTQTTDNSYRPLSAVQYCDKYGKSALYDYFILGGLSDLDIAGADGAKVRALPNSPITEDTSKVGATYVFGQDVIASNLHESVADLHQEGNILLKDCRESVSFNFNAHLITDSDRFVISPFVFEPNKEKETQYSVTDISNIARFYAFVTDFNEFVTAVGETTGYVNFRYTSSGWVVYRNGTVIGTYADISTIGVTVTVISALQEGDSFSVKIVYYPLERVVFLNKEVNKLTDGYINYQDIDFSIKSGGKIGYALDLHNTTATLNPYSGSKVRNYYISMPTLTDAQLENIKAIAVVYGTDLDVGGASRVKFSIARNVTTLSAAEKSKSWYFGTPKAGFFDNHQ